MVNSNFQLVELNKLKALQLEILKDISSFCNKNNIRYFLMGGTLLGAIRHKGYIPWDDDIDIGMLREDYIRFIDIFSRSNLKEKYYLYGNEVNHNSSFPFLKICLSNSLVIEEGLRDEVFGINIDLFPIDSVSNNYLRLINKIHFILRLRHYKVLKPKRIFIKDDLKTVCRKLIHLFFYFILSRVKISFILGRIYFLLRDENKYDDLSKKGNLVWGYGKKEVVDAHIFDEFILVEFEKYFFSVPKRYDDWLSSVYNDYMLLPDIENRISRHSVKAYLLVENKILDNK